MAFSHRLRAQALNPVYRLPPAVSSRMSYCAIPGLELEIVANACLKAPLGDFSQRRDDRRAGRHRIAAACAKDAAGGWIERTRDVTLENDAPPFDRRVGDGHRGEQRLG